MRGQPTAATALDGGAGGGYDDLVRSLSVAVVMVSSLAWAEPSDLDKAKAYFQAGVEAYDQQHYQVALREFQEAHALSHSAALYFNMAACEEHLEHFQASALLLRQYLIERPQAEDRADVERRIQALETRDAEQRKRAIAPAPPPPPPPAPVAAPPPPPKRKLTLTWIGLGLTGAAGAATIGVGAYTITHHNDLKTGCGATASGCTTAQIDGLRNAAYATDALIGVTAVAAAATIIAVIVETRRARSHADRLRTLAGESAIDGAIARF
jgi:hypothetical protein